MLLNMPNFIRQFISSVSLLLCLTMQKNKFGDYNAYIILYLLQNRISRNGCKTRNNFAFNQRFSYIFSMQ